MEVMLAIINLKVTHPRQVTEKQAISKMPKALLSKQAQVHNL